MLVARTKLALAVAAVAAVAMMGSGPASAKSTGGGVVVGHGTISPGLTNTPAFQSVSFTGTLVAAGAPASAAGSYNCTFTGSSSIKETSAKGKGTARGTCRSAKG